MSYLSCDWVARKTLEEDKQMRKRVARFMQKGSWDTQYSDDEPFNPAYIKIDRLIDDGDLGGQLHYLVKWCALPYDSCTWESAELVNKLDPSKVTGFYKSKILSEEKRNSYAMKQRKFAYPKFNQLAESPIYKNENQLRAYQLEGLNWLMYCWYKKQNCILADEMGLGKTIQSTAFLNQIFTQEKVIGPFLIVVPLSTMGNWEREIRGWTTMNLVAFHGNALSRNLIIETEFYYRDENVPNTQLTIRDILFPVSSNLMCF